MAFVEAGPSRLQPRPVLFPNDDLHVITSLSQRKGGFGVSFVFGRYHTADGSEILHLLRLVVSPIIYKVLYIQKVVVWDF